jgi:NAD(P)-dependent dehydrogenase (short-subunit alcohol dehydrogenase family)
MTSNAPVAAVIGGGNGIGQATAQRLASSGAKVVVADIDGDAAEAVAVNLRGGGATAVAIRADVVDENEVEAVITLAVDRFGRLDWAVNVAGVTSPSCLLADVSCAQFKRIVDVNLLGTYLAMRAELRAMLAAGAGSIVNVSSAAGLVAVPGAAAYTASKHAVVGLTKSAAIEYLPAGIRINCVAPSHIDTDMIHSILAASADPAATEAALLASVPAGRLGAPRDVAEAIAYLLSDAASYIHGAVLPVDGGYVAV